MFALKHYYKRASAIAELLAGGVPRFGGTVISFAPEEEVLGEGDPTENFLLVMGGLFRAVKFTPDGRRQVFAFYMAGDLCGLEPDGTHKLTIEAADDAAMAILPRRSCRLRMIDEGSERATRFRPNREEVRSTTQRRGRKAPRRI